MWSFVGKKQWILLVLDVHTREIVGAYIGERSEAGAQGLWNSLLGVFYPQCAIAYTDFWNAYVLVFPSK
jgi:insertion element IS1 protein InsB